MSTSASCALIRGFTVFVRTKLQRDSYLLIFFLSSEKPILNDIVELQEAIFIGTVVLKFLLNTSRILNAIQVCKGVLVSLENGGLLNRGRRTRQFILQKQLYYYGKGLFPHKWCRGCETAPKKIDRQGQCEKTLQSKWKYSIYVKVMTGLSNVKETADYGNVLSKLKHVWKAW